MDHWKRSIWWLVGDTPKSSSPPPPSSTYKSSCQEMRLKMKFKCQLTCCHQQISPSAGLLLALADVITHALCAAAQCLGDLNGFEAKRSWGWHSPQYQPPENPKKGIQDQISNKENVQKQIYYFLSMICGPPRSPYLSPPSLPPFPPLLFLPFEQQSAVWYPPLQWSPLAAASPPSSPFLLPQTVSSPLSCFSLPNAEKDLWLFWVVIRKK